MTTKSEILPTTVEGLKTIEARIVHTLNKLTSNLDSARVCIRTIEDLSIPIAIRTLAEGRLKRIKVRYPNPIEDITPEVELCTSELKAIRNEIKRARIIRSNSKTDL
jgi:hypothetical protein